MRHGLAPAKVNLTLRVTGRRADGYHLLDSLVAFADFGDRLTVADGDGLAVTGPFATGVPTDERNLVRRALVLAGRSASVVIDKHLPHPGGLGGGSSDAACALRLLGASPSVAELLTLGADLPVCLAATAARMRGVGEVVTPVTLPSLACVLVHPGIDVPTPSVFRALAMADDPGHGVVPNFGDAAECLGWLAGQGNDLEAAAIGLAPGIADVLAAIRSTGAAVTRMSGSGATCFGLYPTASTAALAAERLARVGWWVRACRLG